MSHHIWLQARATCPLLIINFVLMLSNMHLHIPYFTQTYNSHKHNHLVIQFELLHSLNHQFLYTAYLH